MKMTLRVSRRNASQYSEAVAESYGKQEQYLVESRFVFPVLCFLFRILYHITIAMMPLWREILDSDDLELAVTDYK